jgi:hypothetical protein
MQDSGTQTSPHTNLSTNAWPSECRNFRRISKRVASRRNRVAPFSKRLAATPYCGIGPEICAVRKGKTVESSVTCFKTGAMRAVYVGANCVRAEACGATWRRKAGNQEPRRWRAGMFGGTSCFAGAVIDNETKAVRSQTLPEDVLQLGEGVNQPKVTPSHQLLLATGPASVARVKIGVGYHTRSICPVLTHSKANRNIPADQA